MDRRSFLAVSAVSGLGIGTASAQSTEEPIGATRNRIKQSVCGWCYKGVELEDLAKFSVKIGIKSIELVKPKDWPTLKKHGLICAMSPGGNQKESLNRIKNHERCLAEIKANIDITSEAGFPNVICFSGNRNGMDDAEGMKNCETALKQIVGYAEKKNVNICMELFNSKVNHKDYMCDSSEWAVELAKRVGSPNFGLLYDIYHMQVQEGNVIATIKKHHEHFFHYHTAGVPGRNEIDNTQELYYPAIVKAIIETGYKGYLAQEFKPKSKEPLKSLAQAVRICDV
jgi:hydroxypyruvate isomerase